MAQQNINLRLNKAVELPGCPICRIVLQRVAQSMESINYEFVNDSGWRAQVERSWGFCNLHAQQWLERAHPLGSALIYEAVLGQIADQMIRQRPHQTGFVEKVRSTLSTGTDSSAGPLTETGECPFCVIREQEAAMVLVQLLSELETPALQERYAASDGLCVTHLNAVLRLEPRATAFRALQDRLLETHQQLQEQLHEIIRKHDYRFHDELPGDERGSVERAVHHVAGLPGIGDRRCRPASG